MASYAGAVIGCGRMGAYTSESVRRFAPASWLPLSHVEAMQAHEDVRLVAACDRDEAALSKTIQEFGIDRGFADHQELLEQVRPSVAGIATRTPGRSNLIADCLHSGVRALHVEKPLCNSVEELLRLRSLLLAEDVYVTFGTIRRLLRPYRRAFEMAKSGRYGRITEIHINMGRGQLYWTHPHSIDLLLFFAEGRRIEKVQASLSEIHGEATRVTSDPVVEFAIVTFSDGVRGHILAGPTNSVAVIFESGEICVEADGRELAVYEPAGPYFHRSALEAEHDRPGGTWKAVDQLVRCLEGDASARQENAGWKEDILEGQMVLFAMVQSHLQGSCPVTLSEVDPTLRIDALTGSNPA